MSNLISINVQEASPAQSVHHSARSTSISYLITNPSTITTFRHDLESMNTDKSGIDKIGEYFELRKAEINQDYKDNSNNRNIKKGTKLYQEAVISFGREQFEQNNQTDITNSLNSFCDNFEKKYGCKVLMSSLHLDEGHKDDAGNILHNYHAHVLIENYSFTTHKTCLQKLDYRKLQTELARDFEHLGFSRGQEYDKLQKEENQQAKLEGRLPEQIKPVRLEHKQYREKQEQLSQQIKLEALPKDKIIENFKQQLEQKDLELGNLEILYKQTREELKTSGMAKQADYQDLKKLFDSQKIELARQIELTRLAHENFEKLQKEKAQEKAKLEEQTQILEQKAEELKTELKFEKIQNDILTTENLELKTENSRLKTAIERFLDLPMIKGITAITKTVLERFNLAIDHFRTNQVAPENQNNTMESKTKFCLSDNQTRKQVGINKNEDVLRYFEKYDTDKKILAWRESGKIETSNSFHYLADENPERVAHLLSQEFKVSVDLEKNDLNDRQIQNIQEVEI